MKGCLFGLLVYGTESHGVIQEISFISVLKEMSSCISPANAIGREMFCSKKSYFKN